jgi:surfactin synthase thioesterase subunit
VLPGRETRLREPAFTSMPELVAALDAALVPYLEGPFVIFGHSMGAGVAFEWTHRRLTRGARLPQALILSSARAPKLRTSVLPEPSEQELLAQLEANLGRTITTAERELLLPIATADTRLYRQWLPLEQAPLPVPLVVYGGDADASLPREALEPWKEESSLGAQIRLFRGGHFYFQENPDEFFEALRRDLPVKSL